MILKTIELENFGLYADRQRLDLEPRGGRPVVLLGGRNGAGKTTLLEAVRLALYGRRALGFRVAQSEYEDHLRSRMHVARNGDVASQTAVSLAFDYAEGGSLQHYRVERQWKVRGTKVIETLLLEKDGLPVDTVPREEWHSFLQELIPPGVSQLFFFDGEKIAEIASDVPDEGLAEAVRGLLGIELVGRLRTDLGLYLSRHGRQKDGGAADTLEEIVTELAALERDHNDKNEALAELRSRRVSKARLAADTRRRFVAEGGEAASRRAKIEADIKSRREQLARREGELRDLGGGLLPFATAPRLTQRFAKALSAIESSESGAEAAALRARLLAWRATAQPPRSASWSSKHWSDLDRFLEADASAPPTSHQDALHSVSRSDRRKFAALIADARQQVAPRVALLVTEIETHSTALKELDLELTRASGRAAGVLLDELLQAEKDLGAVEAELRAGEEELRIIEARRSSLEREQRRILDAQTAIAAGEERAELATRVGRALRQYEERLLERKLDQLRHEFVRRFNFLVRKGEFVADVEIDRTNFDATLIDRSGRAIKKSSLSAGEKQVYAISMLWALARTSGRPLPMIIDTPLARLDSEHRLALVERYFPQASHQVIVLSTDTEIDEVLLEQLGPSISHRYLLDYSSEDGATFVHRGYFGEEDLEEDHGALQQA